MANQIIRPTKGAIQVQISRAAIGTVSNVLTANFANYAANVTSSNQPNITSVGTLSNLSVSGNTTLNNVIVTGNLLIANLSVNTANYSNFAGTAHSVAGANVSGEVAYAAVANAVAGANVSGEVAFATTANSVAGANVSGEVAYAAVANAVAGANVSGEVAFATTANSVAGANVSGEVAFATTANSVAGANVSGEVAYAAVANSIAGANVSGEVAFATTANAVAGANVSGEVAFATTANAVAGANVSGEVAFAAVANSIAGANVSGEVAFATTANSVAGANVSGEVAFAAVANSVAGANVSGEVANATNATTAGSANSVAGANVSGAVANATFADTVATVLDNITTGDMDVMVYDGDIKYTSNVTIDVSTGLLKAKLFSGDGSSLTNINVDNINNGASNVSIPVADGNVEVYANGQHWTFTDEGNLLLAGGNGVIQSIANSSLDVLNPNVSTMVLTPDQANSSQALVLDPTSPGHLHLRVPGSDIDHPQANLYLGGEASSFEVGIFNGSVPNLFIHSNNQTWTFDNGGNLTLPKGAKINTYPNSDVDLKAGPGANTYIALNSNDGNSWMWVDNLGSYIGTNWGPGAKQWTFDDTGNTTMPGNVTVNGNVTADYLIGNGSLLTNLSNVYGAEFHVSDTSGNDDNDGSLLYPVKSIAKALTLVNGVRKTIIVHPGDYPEDLVVNMQYTVLQTMSTGGNSVEITGSLTLAAPCSIDGFILKSVNITSSTGSGSVYLWNSTIKTSLTKSGSQSYVEINNVSVQATGGILISGPGTVSIDSNKNFLVTVNHANAIVAMKNCTQVLAPTVVAGTLYINDCGVFSATSTSNAVTSSAGTVVSMTNCQVVTAAGAPARVSLAGFYSLNDVQYDKANSTITGTSLGTVAHFQGINIDTATVNLNLNVGGNVTGNLLRQTANNIGIGNLAGATTQGINSIAIGRNAGANVQTANSIAIGFDAANTNQGSSAIAIGRSAGQNTQANLAIAIGRSAGNLNQQAGAVAVGDRAGSNTQGTNSIAIGTQAANITQGAQAIAIGGAAGSNVQGFNSISIGTAAGFDHQGANSVAIGTIAGQYGQKINSVAIGNTAGNDNQGANAVAIGAYAGATNQANNSIILNATGASLDQITANTFTVKPVRQGNTANAMYYNSNTGEITYDTAGGGSANTGNVTFDDINIIGTGNLKLQPNSANAGAYLDIFLTAGPDIHIAGNGETVILGTDNFANVAVNVNGNVSIQASNGTPQTWNFGTDGNLTLPANTFAVNYANGDQVSIGGGGGATDWANIGNITGGGGPTSIAIGQGAQETTPGTEAVAIGASAGNERQGNSAVAVGVLSGNYRQGDKAVAVGINAGASNQGDNAVAVGNDAGGDGQRANAVAVGNDAGNYIQGNAAVAIGVSAGKINQGDNSIAIGAGAGANAQGNNSIILNATGANLNQTVANTFTVAPVRNDIANTGQVMFYNTTSKEVTYGNTISVAGDITATNFIGNGSQLTGIVATSATNATALRQNTSTATTVYPTFTTLSANGNSQAVFNTSISANLANGSITATRFVGLLLGVASGATVAGTVQNPIQTTITSVGNLDSLTVVGNINSPLLFNPAVNLQGNSLVQMQYSNGSNVLLNDDDIGTGSWFYINSSGAIWDSNATGTIKSVILDNNGNINADGSVTATNFIGNGSQLTGLPAQPGTYGNGNVTTLLASANVTTDINTSGNFNATGKDSTIFVSGNITTNKNIAAGGNVQAINITTSGYISATGTISTPGAGSFGANLNMNTKWINNVGYPNLTTDVATKAYVDTMASTGIAYHQPVNVATTTTLAVATNGGTTYVSPNGAANGIGAYISTTGTFSNIDGVNVQTVGTRILVKNEVNSTWNGVYTYANTTAIVRSTDADEYGPDSTTQFSINDYFFTQSGTVNTGIAFIVGAPTGPITFGTSNITFSVFNSSLIYTGGTGITIAGTVVSVNPTQTLSTLSVSGDINAGNLTVAETTTFSGVNITSVASINQLSVDDSSIFTGTVTLNDVLFAKQIVETISIIPPSTTSLQLDMSLGSIFSFNPTGNFTLAGLSNSYTGTSAKIIITQPASGGAIMTSSIKFAGGLKTLSVTPGAIDIIEIFSGFVSNTTVYYAKLTNGYA